MDDQKEPLSIDAFVDRLIEEKGFDNLDGEVLSEIKKELKERVEDRINVVVLAHLPPNKLEEFEKIVTQGTDDEMQTFPLTHIPNLNELLAAELLDFRNRYINP